MIQIKKPRMIYMKDTSIDSSKYGRFVVEPLERGYGITLGNSLRRVLLGAFPGAAINAVRIDGVLHEFSTIPGVLEDVTDIILNLKQVVVKLADDESVTVTIDKKGPGEVKAGDIQCVGSLQIINPEHHIATLNEDGHLNIELVIEKGRGYILAEKNIKQGQPLNTLNIDAMFSPIIKVNYTVEDTRVGQDINYDKLTMELWTNGSVKPDEATCLAAKLLREHLSLFIDYIDNKQQDSIVMVSEEKEKVNKYVDISIKDVEFSVRSRNCLKRTSIKTIGELALKSAAELLEIKNFGQKSLNEIREKLRQYGLGLKDDPPNALEAGAIPVMDVDDDDDDEAVLEESEMEN